MIKSLPPLKDDEEYVSYDVVSLFTNIPLKDTIEYILDQVYNVKVIKPFCKKAIFKRLLYKLTTECTFQFNSRFLKQTDGCSMGGPLSVILADIHMVRTENAIVRPMNPVFFKRYVDNIYTKRKKNIPDTLFSNLNGFHPNIKLTIEVNPNRFLDTQIVLNQDGTVTTSVVRKETQLPIPWVTKAPKRYKRNTIIGDLHRSKRISSNFNKEIHAIKQKYDKAGYPKRFISSIIKDFTKPSAIEES